MGLRARRTSFLCNIGFSRSDVMQLDSQGFRQAGKPPDSMRIRLLFWRSSLGLILLQVLGKPIDRQLLCFLSLFAVDAVMLDPPDGDQLLDTCRSFIRRNRVIFVIEQLFVFRDDEQPSAFLR